QMHIGHLRSTVIGECVSRVLEFAGHSVHRENHVGDWGTQFGMLVAYMRRKHPDAVDSPDKLIVNDLEQFYVEAKLLFDEDETFKTESRETVVQLQQGDENTRMIWKVICDVSLRHCHEIYRRLDVTLEDVGESFYQDLMHEVVSRLETLRDQGADWIRESDGAFCVFPEGYVNKDGDPVPEIVRKSDGGFGYFGSDLATIIDRVERLKAERIIYVVGTQTQHLQNVYATARRAGWATDVELTHLKFGNILAANGKPFKTREGGTYKLKDVMDEAVARARKTVEAQMTSDPEGRQFSEEEITRISEVVGLGAVKYYDMARALQGDYRFDLDSMCALEGNTAPYMMYAYARIRSIARKAGVDLASLADSPIRLEHPTEIELGLKLLQFGDAVDMVARDLKPNMLTDYLFDLAKSFSRFYDKSVGVRVVDAPEEWRDSRLRLCDLTARTLKRGLFLLGIGTVEQM
ncbi:MAG: arginine--tRNA ligase, partial [Phycisphaerae bacterium]